MGWMKSNEGKLELRW